jgi:NADH-quinone oxidoreductase subunit N
MNIIIASALLGVLLMLSGVFINSVKGKRTLAVLAAIALMVMACVDIMQNNVANTLHFNGMMATNSFTAKLNAIIAFCSMLYLFLFSDEISKVGMNDAEYFALIFFALTGVFVLTSYQSMFMLFLGIEILSIPQYILAGSDKRNLKSNEASLKYFLMGAFSTGFLLMGITLIYGATGTFDISKMAIISNGSPSVIALLGILFLIVALGFKGSAAPFHVWTPDVYDGTPTTFTPFMASIAKVAIFAAFIHLFQTSFVGLAGKWHIVILALIVLTLLIGNVTAVYQQSVKRMLAYSSIAQAGFLLFAVYALPAMGQKAILIYGASYILATMIIFAVLVKLKDYTYDGFNGLAKQEPVLAFTASIALFSMAGIPLTGGFFGKYYMLMGAMQNGMPMWILIFAVLMAAISVSYYFKVIQAMYFKNSTENALDTNVKLDGPFKAMLIIASIAIIALGVLPGLASYF